MLTIKATIKKDGLRVDRKYNVKLVFTYKRRVKRVSTSLFVGAEDLTKNGDFRKGTNIYRRIEALVEDCRERCYRLEVDRHDYSVEDICQWQSTAVSVTQFCHCGGTALLPQWQNCATQVA